MQIIIAILLMGNVESNLNIDSIEQYTSAKKVVQVVRVINGIKW